MTIAHRIDVHHHPSPPSYINARDNRNRFATPQLQWTVNRSLEDMDRGGVATSILSLPHPPSIWPAEKEIGRRLAREWNEYMSGMARDYPGRFGVFAAVPIFDIEGSLREVEYALDTLKADGISLMTNIGDQWLGDPHYAPLFEELHRRKAVVYTHPHAPACCGNIITELNDSVIEYATDTSRAIAKLLFTGSAAKFPDIRFIFSHGGGTMPYIAERFFRAHIGNPLPLKERVPNGVLHELKKLYYDTAQASHPYAMGALTKLVGASQIIFGTDFPYRTAEDHVKGLAECDFTVEERQAIDRGNAERLMPRWRRK
ncbi:MAG: amidohydrolase family protein [Burkholderiales bacterium]